MRNERPVRRPTVLGADRIAQVERPHPQGDGGMLRLTMAAVSTAAGATSR